MPARFALFAALALVGCTSDPHLEAAKEHLDGTLNDGDFEVVRWWPAKPLPEYNDVRLKYFVEEREKAEAEGIKAVAAMYQGLAEKEATAPVLTMGRLKYRAKNAVGGKVLVDEIFAFDEGGKVVGTVTKADDEPNATLWRNRDKLFPE